MLADLVNGGGCLAEGSDSNNPLAKLSKSVVEGPASVGKQPMHHGQHDPLMGLQGGPSSSMNGTLPSMGPEEHAFMQAFHAAPPEEVAAELSRAWAASQMMPSGEASSLQDGAWLEAAAAQNAAWREARKKAQLAAREAIQKETGGNVDEKELDIRVMLECGPLPMAGLVQERCLSHMKTQKADLQYTRAAQSRAQEKTPGATASKGRKAPPPTRRAADPAANQKRERIPTGFYAPEGGVWAD